MENRKKCPYCGDLGYIMYGIHRKTGERIYVCDRCNDMWEDLDFSKDKSISLEMYMLKEDRKKSDFMSWQYFIK